MLRDASLFLEYYRRPVSAPPEFTLDFVAGFQLRCSTADLSAVAETCITEDYAPKSEFYIRQGMTVLDIGANMGSYTIWAAHQGARVYALEPERNNVVRLEANIQLNKLQPNIIVVPDAIFSHTGVVRLAVSALSPGGHTTGVIDGVEVPSVTIADLLIRENIDSVDILKIDVEGAEYEIFGSIEKETFSKINSIVGEYHLRPGRLENFQTLYKILSPHYAHVKSYYPFYFYAHN
jgi:FkbM family methyltransferase